MINVEILFKNLLLYNVLVPIYSHDYGTYSIIDSNKILCKFLYSRAERYLYLHDIRINLPYSERYRFLQYWMLKYTKECTDKGITPTFRLAPCYHPENFSYLMEEIKAKRIAGILGYNFTDMLGNTHVYKPQYAVKFIVAGFIEKYNKLEAVICGQMNKEVLEEVCYMTHFTDALRMSMKNNKAKYIYKVFEATCATADNFESHEVRFKQWFLRYPANKVVLGNVRYDV